jgi:uncharacterized protein (DUF697 family)
MSVNKRKLPKAIQHRTGYVRQLPVGSHADQDANWSTDDANAVVGMTFVPPIASAPAEPAPSALTPARTGFLTERRLSRAHAIVERHATYSAAGGIIPLPIANVASVTAIIVRMVKMLSKLYDVPFERNRARAIVVGMVGGAMPTGLAAVVSSTLQYLVPASALVGLAVSSIAAVASTRGIGLVFIEHFEGRVTLSEYPAPARETREVSEPRAPLH